MKIEAATLGAQNTDKDDRAQDQGQTAEPDPEHGMEIRPGENFPV
jgi:hypothetical protein